MLSVVVLQIGKFFDNILAMSKDRFSFSDLGSHPPRECPTKSACREVLKQAKGKRGDFILDNDNVLGSMLSNLTSGDPTRTVECHEQNGDGCAFDPIMKRDYQEYREKGSTPSA